MPFVVGAQGTYGVLPLTYWPEKYLLKWSYRQAREIIVPSKFTADKILEYSKANYNISVIHNGVNFKRFQIEVDLASLREKYKNNKIIITVGGIKLRKGQDLVVRAVAKIKKDMPNIKYLIIGGDEGQKDYLEDLISNLGLRNNIEFVGIVSDEDIVKYFKISDLYVHTPRLVNLNFEGFGIVYLEAGACKKPIVAMDTGGIRDAVIHNKTGLIVKDGDIDGIASSVLKIFKDKNLYNKLGSNGYAYAKEHDWPLVAKQYINLYKKYTK